MRASTPLGDADPEKIASFWNRYVASSGSTAEQPDAWPFGDSVEMANELLQLVLDGTKRATAGAAAEYELEAEPLPTAGQLDIVLDGAMQPRAVIELAEVRIGPLDSVDDQFAWDEGEGDRSRTYWLDAHTEFFSAFLPTIGLAFDAKMETVFQRFTVRYQE